MADYRVRASNPQIGPRALIYTSSVGKKHRPAGGGASGSKLDEAITLHRSGKLIEAIRIYESQTQLPKARQYLGVAHCQLGDRERGLELLRSAVEACPQDSEALANLAVVLHEEGQFDESLNLIERAATFDPSNADLLDKRGFILQDLGRHGEAIQSFDLALQIDPQHPDVWFHRGYSQLELREYGPAEASLREVVRLTPQNDEAWTNLGNALLGQFKGVEALQAYRKAIDLRPSAQAYHALAGGLSAMADLPGALRAAQTATQLEPKRAEYQAHLGSLLSASKRTADAIERYERAVSLEPANESLTVSLATLRNQTGDFDGAMQVLGSLDDPSPAAQLVRSILVPVIPKDVQEMNSARQKALSGLSELANVDGAIDDPMQQVNLTSFYWSYHSEGESELQQAAVDAYRHLSPSLFWESPWLTEPRSGKLRVGVVSSFLRRHTIGKLFLPLISALKTDDIEVISFDASDVADDWTLRLNHSVDFAYKLNSDLSACRSFIAEQRLDALFYPEIGMNPFTYYLAFARLAPLQFMTWGHPASTALPSMDCFLSSRDLESPGSEVQYSEELVQFEHLMTQFERPEYNPVTRADLGLPDDRHLYVCPQSLFKFHPDFDATLAEVLRRDADGDLILLTGNEKEWDDRLLARFAHKMPDVSDRIHILRRLDWNEYIGLCDHADAILDTFYFGGGNSSLEAFSVGAPIVTLPGNMLRGRITYAQYRAMEMDDLVAHDPAHYVDLVVRLATDSDWRASMRQQILERNAVLFENPAPKEELRGFLRTRLRK